DGAAKPCPDTGDQPVMLSIPWSKAAAGRRREIIVPNHVSPAHARPLRAETRAKLITSIARGRRWLSEIASGAVAGVDEIAARPVRAATRARLIPSIARGRRWLSEIAWGAVAGVEEIAARENCSRRHVNLMISLAFLAPSLIKAVLECRLAHGIGVARLFDPP